jgi:PEP-CTERM motif
MMRAAAVLTFAAMLLIAGVTEVPAVAFNSGAGIGSCSGTATFPLPTTCAGGFVAIDPNSAWQPNNPGGSSAVWVSYTAGTGSGGVVVAPNSAPPLTPANATETFTIGIPAGFGVLNLLVWADDTAGLRLDGSAAYLASTTPGASAPNPVQGVNCANGGLTCTAGGGAAFSIPLGGLAHTLAFDVFQRSGASFGLLYQGDLTPIPEPTTMFLVGSVLAGVGVVSRRRLRKKQAQVA